MTEDRFYPGKQVQVTAKQRQYEEPAWLDQPLTVANSDEVGALVRNGQDDARWIAKRGLETWRPPAVDSMAPEPELSSVDIARPEKQALRFNAGKPELSYALTFGDALREMAKVCAYGAGKYERANYTKGARLSQSVDCLLRHLLAWQEGEDRDQESGQLHLAHVVWNALRLCQEAIVRPDLDDRISYQRTSKDRG